MNPELIMGFICFVIPMTISIGCIIYIYRKAGYCSKRKRHELNVYKFSHLILLLHMLIIVVYIACMLILIITYAVTFVTNEEEILLMRIVLGLFFSLLFLFGVFSLVIIPIIKRRCVTVECIFCDIYSTLKSAYHYCC